MTSRTHDLFAFAALTTVAIVAPPSVLNLGTLGVSLIGNIIGALIPDMDQASNKLWELMPAGNFVGKIGRMIFYKHRTLSHSLLGGFLLYKGLEWTLPKIFNQNFINTNIVFASIMIGFASHLFADSLTKEGIPLLFPLKFKIGIPPIKFLRVSTGGLVEKLLVFPGIIAYIVWLGWSNQDKLLNILKLIQTH